MNSRLSLILNVSNNIAEPKERIEARLIVIGNNNNDNADRAIRGPLQYLFVVLEEQAINRLEQIAKKHPYKPELEKDPKQIS